MRVPTLSLAFVSALLVGCPAEAPVDPNEPEPSCASDADAPVEIVLYNERLWYVENPDVTWATDDESGSCTQTGYDAWLCEPPLEGDLTVEVSHPLYLGYSEVVPAGDDGCRTESTSLDVILEAAGEHFDEDRIYYFQRYADAYECENSWVIHGTGCYYTAAFCADGYSVVYLTDIANMGVYDVASGDIENVTFGTTDIPAQTTWSVISDTEIEDWDGVRWVLDTDGFFDPIDCLTY